jgi:hypothetical protein
MIAYDLFTRSYPVLFLLVAAVFVALSSPAAAQTQTSQLGGWVYLDSNDDGQLAFAHQANPEFALPGVTINLFLYDNGVEPSEPLDSVTTDQFGRFLFSDLQSGTYSLRQVQPVEFVDGKDTLGVILNPVPPGAFAGVKQENAFIEIALIGGARGDFYLFGERGLLPQFISKRLLLNSTPPLEPIIPEPATAVLALSAVAGSWVLRRPRRAV